LRDPNKALLEAGEWFPPGSPERQLFERRVYGIQPLATFALTNSLAGYLAPWLVVAAGIGLGAGLSRGPWQIRLAAAICALPVAYCLYLTGSRSGYAAAALGLLLAVLFCRGSPPTILRRLRPAVAVGGVILVVVIVAIAVMAARRVGVFSEASKSFGYRVQYWRSTLRMIADHPIVGCGPGNFQGAYTRYKLPEASEEVSDPHNFLMEVWATAGTPAILALLAVLGCFAYALFAYRRRLGVTADTCSGGEEIVLQANRDTRRHDRRASPKRPDPVSSANAAQTDAWRSVVVGGAAAFPVYVLIETIRMTLAAPRGMDLATMALVVCFRPAVALGLPLAAAAVALLWRWIDDGRLTPAVPAIGVVVLLVNLLAAGGIGFPGVAGSLWLLMALALNMTDPSDRHRLPVGTALAGLLVMIAVAMTCSASAFSPVLQSQAKMALARQDPLRAETHLGDAAVADPLAAEPWLGLGSLAFQRWLQDHDAALDPKAFRDFETCMKTAVELDPNSASTWQTWGDRYRDAFRKTGRQEMAQKAVAAYRRAVELYPNSGRIRAGLALALRAVGDEPGFQREAAAALSLDDLTPHADNKLAPADRTELSEGLLRSGHQEN
jgi:hypothetical protein